MDITINRIKDIKQPSGEESVKYRHIRVYRISGDLEAPYHLQITTHGQGGHIELPGESGLVWVDKDNHVGRSKFDGELNETREDLPYSPWAIRGVMLANRPYTDPGELRITTRHSASSYGQPVVLINGELTDLHNDL